ICALFAAVLWSLNISAIGPVLQLLGEHCSLQESVQKSIKDIQLQIDNWQNEREHHARASKELEEKPPNEIRNKLLRDHANDIAKLESRLDAAATKLYWYRIAEWYLSRYVPTDPFLTLAWVIGLVIVGVAVKGFFEFWQESLVGSVVNLSLFDLRNRFYRNVIHLDVGQFGEQGTSELMARFTNAIDSLGPRLKTPSAKLVADPPRP